MKLPSDATIEPRKITEYLLQRRQEDDKSVFLAQAGYTLENPTSLLADLRGQILALEAEVIGPFEYGTKFRIRGVLQGPNGRALRIVSIWASVGGPWSNAFYYAISRKTVKYPLFSRVALSEDLPKENLRRGDVATVVEYYEGQSGQEPGYELEVFNAVGETIAIATVREMQIEELRSDEVLSVRPREFSAA